MHILSGIWYINLCVTRKQYFRGGARREMIIPMLFSVSKMSFSDNHQRLKSYAPCLIKICTFHCLSIGKWNCYFHIGNIPGQNVEPIRTKKEPDRQDVTIVELWLLWPYIIPWIPTSYLSLQMHARPITVNEIVGHGWNIAIRYMISWYDTSWLCHWAQQGNRIQCDRYIIYKRKLF